MDKEIVPNRLREIREEYKERKKDKKYSRSPNQKKDVKMQKNETDTSDNEEFTLQYMADICEVDKGTISKYETMKSPIPAWVLLSYADEFDVSVDYLLNRSEAQSSENYSAGHELGLTDEAIETLKYIKKNSDLYSNALAVINAFLSQDDYGGNEAFTLFSSIFNALLSEYAEEQQGIPNTGMHESDIMRYIKQYIDETIRPALRKELAKAYKTPRDY